MVLAVGIFLAGYLYWKSRAQGRAAVQWEKHPGIHVTFDKDGIPTFTGTDWDVLLEAQGFVLASDRLFQLDLMRRSASGRIAEWLGGKPAVLAWDAKRRSEDWVGVADQAAADLPGKEKAACEAFARGVNSFIDAYPGKWGVEFDLLSEKPEPWRCRDSLLILLSMVEDLSESIDDEAPAAVWRNHLSASWEKFLFPENHPWNQPLFGTPGPLFVSIPKEEWIKPTPIPETIETEFHAPFVPGSNAWAYRGKAGVFVASDPHLSASVPQLWYPLRFKKGDDLITGVALPGIPGVVIGRNAHIAWGFTNAKQDVDDLLEETVSEDGKRYVHHTHAGKKVWEPVVERPYVIEVRGGQPVQGIARFTHRGPLAKREYLGDGYYSRQWSAFSAGMLRLPTVALMESWDWESFNRAVDEFPSPAQAIIFADAKGGLGIRVSGRDIKRRVSGLKPVAAEKGEWLGFEPASKRPRSYIPPGSESVYLTTANERTYVSTWGEHWSSDQRNDRIRALLSQSDSLTANDMLRIQLDTHSRFYLQLLGWIGTHSKPVTDGQKKLIENWKAWKGAGEGAEPVFAQAVFAETLLTGLVLDRVRGAFLPKEQKKVPYHWKLENAWLLSLMENPSGFQALGMKPSEVASWILAYIEQHAPHPEGYSEANRWKAQHPFARAIPVLGRLFAVDEHPQVGFYGVVRVERPLHGASLRLVWDLKGAESGSWIFPVGQSGHVFSPYYQNFRKRWFAGETIPISGLEVKP